jgi:BRCT domain type II-containing protein
MTNDTPSPHQTGLRGQRDKTSPAQEDPNNPPTRRILYGQRFVLSGTWPGLGGGHGLTLGEDNVKAIIKRHGGSVTLGFLRLTNALVIEDNPGQKKILKAHKQGLSIVELNQITSIITNDRQTAQDLLPAPYPEAATTILTQHNIQVKHPPPTSDPSEHCCEAGSSMDKEVQDQDNGMGVGHSNE